MRYHPAAVSTRFAQLRAMVGLASGVVQAIAIAKTGRSHPRVNGRLEVDGVEAPVSIVRDRFGVPHVKAGSEADAIFGQGFVQAQDRLFQLELFRRAGSGRLAEVAGARVLEADRFARRLGLAGRAERDLAACSDAERALLAAFARGVNAGIRSLRALPPEFAVLRAAPEPWRPEHSMLVGRLLMLGFATNWEAELERERLVAALGHERAALLDVAYPASAATTTGRPYGGASERLLAAYEAMAAAGAPTRGASNAWALTGERTRSGAPLLACDPHLRAGVPGLFHVAHVAGGGLDVIGACVPGLPGVTIGHNRELAWGVTAGLADVSDCYVEAIDPDDPARYRTPGGWERGVVRVERIAVRGAATVEEAVLETRHGPVIGPTLPGEQREVGAIALRSTALEAGETVGPLLAANRARNVAEFEAAVGRWPGATFNFVFAGREGSIGYRMGGSIPRRERGEGLLPQDGARSTGPAEPLPADEMPWALDPPGDAGGAVVSANQAPGGPYELGEEWCAPYRAERIAELLAARDEHTVASMQAIQLDLYNVALVELRDLLLARDAVADAEARAVLARWDGQSSAGSAGAAIMQTVYGEAAGALVARVAGAEADLVLGKGLGASAGEESRFHYRLQGRIVDALAQAAAPWCDDEADRDRVLRAAAERALEELRDRLGAKVERWRWGALHVQRGPHPLDRIPGLGRSFSLGPFAMPGDVNTVWQGGYTTYAGPGAPGGYSPLYRQVLDLGRWDRSTFQLAAGNSGIPGHPHYDDCAREFLEGRQRPLLYSAAAVRANAAHTLTLDPLVAGS